MIKNSEDQPSSSGNSENTFLSEDIAQYRIKCDKKTDFEESSDEDIDFKTLINQKVIGKGGFGLVATFDDPATNKTIAIKKIKKNRKLLNPENDIKKEMRLSRSLRHQNINTTFGIYMSENSGYLTMNYCKMGDLHDYSRKNHPLSHQLLHSFTEQMTNSIKYMHKQNIFHLDIKPRNFLVDESLTVQLCDFGLAGDFNGRLKKRVGTPIYSSPQVALRDYDPFKADIWSLGISFYVITTRLVPFQHCSWLNLKQFSSSVKLTFPIIVRKELQNLIRKMLVYDESQRFDIDQVFLHKWFC